MKRVEKLIALLVMGVVGFLWVPQDYWTAHWWNRWCFSIFAMSLGIGFHLRKIHWSLVLPVTISLISAMFPVSQMVMRFNWRGTVFSGIPNAYQADVVAQSCFTALAFMTIIFYISTVSEEEFKWLRFGFGLFCIISTLAVIAQALHGPYLPKSDPQYSGRLYFFRGGYIGNPSMCACLIAITWPFFIALKNIWGGWKFLPGVAIFLSHASQPIGVMAVMVCVYVFLENKSKFKTAFVLSLFAWAILIGAGFILQRGELFEDSGRFYLYRIAWAHFENQSLLTKLFGYGNGMMAIHFPLWLNDDRAHETAKSFDWFFWLHSDWFQVLVEQGFVGFMAWVTMFVFACFEAAKVNSSLCACVVGFGAMAVFNFPVHLPAHALIGAALVLMAFRFPKANRA